MASNFPLKACIDETGRKYWLSNIRSGKCFPLYLPIGCKNCANIKKKIVLCLNKFK